MISGLKKHVACAVSGGVDSAVAAHLLLKQGYKVTGCFMKNWDRSNESEECTSNVCSADADKEDARSVCKHLNIPFVDIDFTKHYWNKVFSNFLIDYEKGLTPNPDILCNKYIKFKMFYDFCNKNLDAVDFIATGHYAQIDYDSITKRYRLLKSVDELKDQTFFLAQIEPSVLSSTLFPIGSLNKTQVRQLAEEIGLEKISKKRSSVGICFIGKRNFYDFIDQYLPSKKGLVIDIETKKVIGEHEGIHHYTIGQKIKLKKNDNKVFFVAKKEMETQNIYAAEGTDHPALFFNEFYIEKPHWISYDPEEKLSVSQESEAVILDSNINFKFQQKHAETPIEYLKRINSENGDRYLVKVKNSFRGLTAGQFAVFYDKNICIGSSKISQTLNSLYESNFKGDIINSDKQFTKNYKKQIR